MSWNLGQVPTNLQSAPVNVSASGALVTGRTLSDGVTKRTIRVYGLKLVAAAAVTIQFQDGSGAALSGVMSLAANQNFDLPLGVGGQVLLPYYVTSPGNAFNINLGGAVQVSGTIWFDVGP